MANPRGKHRLFSSRLLLHLVAPASPVSASGRRVLSLSRLAVLEVVRSQFSHQPAQRLSEQPRARRRAEPGHIVLERANRPTRADKAPISASIAACSSTASPPMPLLSRAHRRVHIDLNRAVVQSDEHDHQRPLNPRDRKRSPYRTALRAPAHAVPQTFGIGVPSSIPSTTVVSN